MSSNKQANGPFLAFDLGNFYTRAFLFDLSGEHYQLIGYGISTTTLGATGSDINFGIRMAVEELQAVTGRVLLDAHKNLIQPVSRDGRGVNRCLLNISTGPPLKIFIAGFLKDASLRTAQRMARFTGASEIIVHDLDNDSPPEQVIDRLLDDPPDLIFIAGGAIERAFQKIIKKIDPILLAISQLLPENQIEIVYLCNPDWQARVQSIFGDQISLHFVPNSLNPGGQEMSSPWLDEISQAVVAVRFRQIPGLADLAQWATSGIWIAPLALARLTQLLSQITAKEKGVVGIDIGLAETHLSAAYAGRTLSLSIADSDIFSGKLAATDKQFVKEVKLWSETTKVSDNRLQEYIANKNLYPGSKTLTAEDRSTQTALARITLRKLAALVQSDLPEEIVTENGSFIHVEPILITGENFSEINSPGQACLIILDGLQLTGITTLIIDKQHLAVSLGSLAKFDHQIVEQVMNSNVFYHLATVITVVGRATKGTPVLRVKAVFDDGHASIMDIKQGDLEAIPVAPGQFAELQLQPYHRYDIGMGEPGRGGTIKANGSVLGIVIDARGRPIQLSEDAQRRSEQFRKWLWMLGG